MLFFSFRFPFPVFSVLGFRHLGHLLPIVFLVAKTTVRKLTLLSQYFHQCFLYRQKFGLYYKQNTGPSRRMTHLSTFSVD